MMGSYSVDESVLDLPTILYSYSLAVASGYASTDESVNSDKLLSPLEVNVFGLLGRWGQLPLGLIA
jgi:hypothetical protein